MQKPQIHKDKLAIIEWILQLDNPDVLNQIKSMITARESFKLTDEQKLVLEEAAVKFYTVEEPELTWEEVKEIARKKLNEKTL